jgi:hypothetical protein
LGRRFTSGSGGPFTNSQSSQPSESLEYLLGLGRDQLAVFIALNLGIAVATVFRFWSYRQFVWAA